MLVQLINVNGRWTTAWDTEFNSTNEKQRVAIDNNI